MRRVRVSLPFQPRWRPAVLDGSKCSTVRSKRHGSAGDDFVVEGVTFRLLRVEHMALDEARRRHWRDEGMASEKEFVETWVANHPTRGYRGEEGVWVHLFERAEPAQQKVEYRGLSAPRL